MKEFEYYSPTKIVFGKGKLKEVANLLPHESKRVLIVTGRHSSKANGTLDLLKASLKKKDLFLFDEVEQNPGTQTINKGADLARKEKIDFVVALGGGSPIDAAKCIALMATNDGVIENYLIGGKPTYHQLLPIIAIPTTAGTGTEVTAHAVIIVNGQKKGYSNPGFFTKVAILDPLLTLSMPFEVTVNTGIDALTHAIEGYLSLQATPISDSLAIEAIKIIKEWLPKAATNDKDIESRSHMLYASLLGGLVISQARTIILHALSYSLTTFYGIPHGRATGVLLPWVLEFLSTDKVRPVLQKKLSAVIGIFGTINEVHKFINNLGVTTKLRNYGVTEADILRFVQDVWGRRNLPITPKQVSQKDVENIYRQAL